MSSAAATACTRTPRCRLRRTAASLNSALYSWTFFGPARGTRHLPLLGGSVYKSEAGSPVSFKRLLGAGLRPPTDRDERLLLETARTGADPDCRGIRGKAWRLLAPDALSGQNSRRLLAPDVLSGQNSRLPAPAVYLTPLELNVCQVRHRCGDGPPQPDAALVVRLSRGRSIQFDANIGLRHNGRPPVDRCGLLACPRGECGERENQGG